MKNKLVKTSLLLALGEVAYILIVATFFRVAEKYMSDQPDNFFSPVIFLLLLVISAAVSGSLVFGKPVLLYLEGKKNEAVKLLVMILGWLALFFILVLTSSIIITP